MLTFLHVAYAVVLAQNLRGSRGDSCEGEVVWQTVVVCLLRLVHQVARVQHRVIGLRHQHNLQLICTTYRKEKDLPS